MDDRAKTVVVFGVPPENSAEIVDALAKRCGAVAESSPFCGHANAISVRFVGAEGASRARELNNSTTIWGGRRIGVLSAANVQIASGEADGGPQSGALKPLPPSFAGNEQAVGTAACPTLTKLPFAEYLMSYLVSHRAASSTSSSTPHDSLPFRPQHRVQTSLRYRKRAREE